MTQKPDFLLPMMADGLVRADFVARVAGVETSTDREATLAKLKPTHEKAVKKLGYKWSQLRRAEQVHGNQVAVAYHKTEPIAAGADALISNDSKVVLGIYVADCGVIYFYDQRTGAIGLAHSGKKGTEQNICAATIAAMEENFKTRAEDLIVVLGPCIRPPHYEVDIAAQIRDQAIAAGVLDFHYHDCQLDTASDLVKFYSYRVEEGNTGRMLALLARED